MWQIEMSSITHYDGGIERPKCKNNATSANEKMRQ